MSGKGIAAHVLHPRVLKQIERLNGRIPEDFASREWTVATPAGEHAVPPSIQALLAVRWPTEQEMRTDDEYEWGVSLPSPCEVEDGLVAENEPRPWYTIGHHEGQYYLLVDLTEAADASDPVVYEVDHEGDQEVYGGERLSAVLSGLRVPRPPSARSRFPRACAAGDLVAVREALTRRKKLGAFTASGLTPLHLAAFSSRSPELVRALLQAGADPNAIVGEVKRLTAYVPRERVFGRAIAPGSAPLHAALTAMFNSWAGPYDIVRDIVAALLDAGADPNLADARGEVPILYLQTNSGPEASDIIRLLLAAGADPNAEAEWRSGPLHDAVVFALPETVRDLLDAGADPLKPSRTGHRGVDGATPLHVAAFSAREEVLRLLLARIADVDVRTPKGVTPLHVALTSGDMRGLRLLIDAGADATAVLTDPAALKPGLRARTPVEIARELGNTQAVDLLTAVGAAVPRPVRPTRRS
ncbi:MULTISPECIES: ankyrin repeat domain-containing protein [Streptomyces]|uniref:ankyrin repeat domain-containing protein n=1 Tax=Streptomyces TaxID=1883 RepID=UPI0002ECCEB7|nr:MULTISPECIES: ankyrin repeat domain-containing protein [Streptomyces]